MWNIYSILYTNKFFIILLVFGLLVLTAEVFQIGLRYIFSKKGSLPAGNPVARRRIFNSSYTSDSA